MAKSKLSAEQFEEELSRQTTDYNAKRHELDDILAMAELYHKTIEEKVCFLSDIHHFFEFCVFSYLWCTGS